MPRFATTLAPLRHRDFRRLWTGTFCATATQWIQQATLGWVVYEVTQSAAMLGVVLGVRAIPMLLLAPVSGLVADRYDRRIGLAAAQFLMVVIALALAVLLALDLVEGWHLVVFSVLSGVGAVFDRTLRGTLVFHSVPRAEAAGAVALNSIAFSVTRAIGPGVAGFLIASLGAAWNFTIQAFLHLGVTVAALSVSASGARAPAKARASPWHDMRDGLRFAFTDPVARIIVVLGLVPPLLLIPVFAALMPIFAADVFQGGPEGLGLLLSSVGAGGILGGITAVWLSRFDKTGLLQTLSLVVFALALVAFAVSPGIAWASFFLAIAGVAEIVHFTAYTTTLQMCAPEHMRGRMASLLSVFPAFISIGSFTAGLMAGVLGARTVVVVLAALSLAVIAAAWTGSMALRKVTMSGLVGVANK